MFHNKNINTSVRVVLVETTKPWNIGAVARAMDNMGFSKLYLVNPCDHLHEKALALASNSKHLLYDAVVVDSLEKALVDCESVIATTARYRRHFQTYVSSWSMSDAFESQNQTAIVFGRESSGLTNEELELCSQRLFVPAFGESTSLNLGQAVLLILYEVRKILSSEKETVKQKEKRHVTTSQVVNLRSHFETLLEDIEYLKEANRNQISNSLSDLLFRMNITEKDIRILQGIIRRTRKTITYGKKSVRNKGGKRYLSD